MVIKSRLEFPVSLFYWYSLFIQQTSQKHRPTSWPLYRCDRYCELLEVCMCEKVFLRLLHPPLLCCEHAYSSFLHGSFFKKTKLIPSFQGHLKVICGVPVNVIQKQTWGTHQVQPHSASLGTQQENICTNIQFTHLSRTEGVPLMMKSSLNEWWETHAHDSAKK